MKNLMLIALVLITVWLQANFLGGLRPFGVVPDPLIVIIIYAGLTCQPVEAVGMAVLGGLLLDIASGADFGLRTAFYTVLALLVMVAGQAGVDFDNLGLTMAMTAGATTVFDSAVLASVLAQHGLVSWSTVTQRLLLHIGLNLVLVLVLRPVLVRLLKTAPSLKIEAKL